MYNSNVNVAIVRSLAVAYLALAACKPRIFNEKSSAKSESGDQQAPGSASFDERFPASDKVIMKCTQDTVEVATMFGRFHGDSTVSEIWFEFSQQAKAVKDYSWLLKILSPSSSSTSNGKFSTAKIKVLMDGADKRDQNCEWMNTFYIPPIMTQGDSGKVSHNRFKFKTCAGISKDGERIEILENTGGSSKSESQFGLIGNSKIGLKCELLVDSVQNLKARSQEDRLMDPVLLDRSGNFFKKGARDWKPSADHPLIGALKSYAVQFKVTDSRNETHVGYAAAESAQNDPKKLAVCQTDMKIGSQANIVSSKSDERSAKETVSVYSKTDLGWLINCDKKGVKRIEIPFSEMSKIELVEPPNYQIQELMRKQLDK